MSLKYDFSQHRGVDTKPYCKSFSECDPQQESRLQKMPDLCLALENHVFIVYKSHGFMAFDHPLTRESSLLHNILLHGNTFSNYAIYFEGTFLGRVGKTQ